MTRDARKPNSVRVKICGITRGEDAELAVELGAWAIGFVFYNRSSRFVLPGVARSIRSRLPSSVRAVGVFVDSSLDEIVEIIRESEVNVVQLHGSETPEYCEKLKELMPRIDVIKAIRVRSEKDLQSIADFQVCDAILLDSFVQDAGLGGTGNSFDWKAAEHELRNLSSDLRSRLIVAGGIRQNNVRAAIEIFSPYAIDLSSGVEKSPGLKDERLMRDFFLETERIGKEKAI